MVKELVSDVLTEAIESLYGIVIKEVDQLVEIPPEDNMGDFSLPCFGLAKQLKKSPIVIAGDLQDHILTDKNEVWLNKAAAVNGYLNLFINRGYYVNLVCEEINKGDLGAAMLGRGKTICIDYSSPNIAKKFHVGHLRTTVIGNSLYHIYSKLGYQVIRINYLGDWGTQFGKLIMAYKQWSSKEEVETGGIEELLRIYVKFSAEAKNNDSLNTEAREWFAKMEKGDEEALSVWKWFKDISMKEFDRVYQLLDVTFDSWQGESFYMDKVPALVRELKQKGLLEESEGANIIRLDEDGMPPCLITKQDGSSIYHSRDIAAAIYRKKVYDFSECLYVTGVEQKLHFVQIFKALSLMGYEWAKNMRHIPYGLVSMGGKKLSSREGNIVYAEAILKEAIERALVAIKEKNPALKDKESAAEKIGVGAVIFHDLSNQLIKDVHFSWEEVLNFDGMTAPYIQYTYARANSILRKAGDNAGSNAELSTEEISRQTTGKIKTQHLEDDCSYGIIKLLGDYPNVIIEAAKKYEPCIVARYAYRLAGTFNKFYQENRILDADRDFRPARLFLTEAARDVIGDAMSLLGIKCPEEM